MAILRIAFVANNKNPALFMADPAFIYRCENLALALQQAGHYTELLHISQLSSQKDYDVIVLHRPKKSWLTRIRLSRFRRKGCKILADFDDLVFLPEWAHVSPGVINGVVSLPQTQKNFLSHQQALAYCDAALVSVAPLLTKMEQQIQKPVLLLPNTVHISWYALNEAADRLQRPRLTYFPGTRSHDQDFATIKPVLEQILDETPELQLQITGVLTTDLKCRSAQLLQYPKQPFAGYANHVAQSWLNLAPLQDTEFNNHKSALKALEAAWFNAPTLASPIPDMLRLQNAGAILMRSTDDWYHSIKAHLDPEYYAKSSADLRQRILLAGRAEQNAQHFLQFVTQL